MPRLTGLLIHNWQYTGLFSVEREKTFFSELVQQCLPTQGEAPFCAEIWSLKASVGRIAACACLCRFSAPFKSFVEFSRYFDHEHGKGTNN